MAFKSQVTITRPANTTAYTAGDVVGGVLTFEGIGDTNSHLLITYASLRVNVSAIPAGMTSFRLHLYTQRPASGLADNAAWDLPSGDRDAYAGYIDLGSPADVGSSLFAQAEQINRQLAMASASGSSLYGYLVSNGAYTPGSGEVYAAKLLAVALP